MGEFTFMEDENEKDAHFYKRTEEHIGRVKANAELLAEHFPDIRSALIDQVMHHDASKYENPELEPYVEITWKYKCQADGVSYDPPTDLQEMMHQATMHHIQNNKHHPEYWDENFGPGNLNEKDRDAAPDKMVDGTKMDKVSIAEMCADWCSMSQEKGNSNSAHEWARQNVNKRWKFTDEQVSWIYMYLDKFVEVLGASYS